MSPATVAVLTAFVFVCVAFWVAAGLHKRRLRKRAECIRSLHAEAAEARAMARDLEAERRAL